MGVSRKDKLTGLRGIAGGAIDLAMATDRSEDMSYRRTTLGFGVTSIVVGIGQARGFKQLQAGGSLARLGLVARQLFTTFGQRRESARHVASERPPVVPGAPLFRRERLGAVNDIVGGAVSLGVAADRSLQYREQFAFGAIGAASLVRGIGRLRQLQPADAIAAAGYAIAGAGYLIAAGSGGVTTARRRRRR